MDWLITALSILSTMLLAEGLKVGWAVTCINQLLWIWLCIRLEQYGLIGLSLFKAVWSARGYYKFGRLDRRQTGG